MLSCGTCLWKHCKNPAPQFKPPLSTVPQTFSALYVKKKNQCKQFLNFFFQALFGKVLFGEALALLWWLGASLILFGLVFLNYSAAEQEKEERAKRTWKGGEGRELKSHNGHTRYIKHTKTTFYKGSKSTWKCHRLGFSEDLFFCAKSLWLSLS